MAVNKNAAYDHPMYNVPLFVGGANTAGASAVSLRFTAFTSMVVKSVQVTPIIAGTGTGNAQVVIEKIAAGGTALTTLANIVMGTNAAGVTTNVAVNTNASSTLAAGDVIRAQHGADAQSVFSVGVELAIAKGGNVTGDI